VLPEIETARLTLRLAQPGLERAMAAFLAANFEGHLDRWSPPVSPAFFTERFWAERMAFAVDEYHADRAARFVIQPKGGPEGEVIGTANYTNIVRGAFQACHLGYQVAASHEGRGLMAEALHAAIPNSELVLLPDVGHQCNLEAPEPFNAELRRFLHAVV